MASKSHLAGGTLMRMQLTLGGSVLLLLFSNWGAAAQEPQQRPLDNGVYLLRACGNTLIPQDSLTAQDLQKVFTAIHCTGFIDGMMDMNKAYRDIFLKVAFDRSDLGFFCLPPQGIAVEQAIRIVVKYLEGHQEDLHLTRRSLVWTALGEAFPCKGNPELFLESRQ